MLALLLAIYAFAIFGYITATVASLIVHVDQAAGTAEKPLDQQIAALRADIHALREAVTARNHAAVRSTIAGRLIHRRLENEGRWLCHDGSRPWWRA